MKVILFIMSVVIVYLLSKVFNQAREIDDLKYDNKLYKGKINLLEKTNKIF
jgi:hypothetical protein